VDRAVFLAQDNWLGSYYELSLELGPTGDDARLISALRSLWSQPQLHGSWTVRDCFGQSSSPLLVVDGFVAPRYGTINLSDGHQLGCVSHTVREYEGSDWLDLCIPTGMLELAYDVKYPLEYASNSWMRKLDRLLVALGSSLFLSHPFRLGLIGEEASGFTHADSVSAADCTYGPLLLPQSLWQGLDIELVHSECAPGLIAVGVSDCQQ